MHEDALDQPESAITSFERLTGLRVTVHDVEQSLWPILPPQRFAHQGPWCDAVKAAGFSERCVAFDGGAVRADLAQRPAARIQRCHAGLVEWVAPVTDGERLRWVLFAGQRVAGPDLTKALGFDARRRSNWPAADLPPPVESAEALDLLEALRQLAARLTLWRQMCKPMVVTTDAPPTDPARRRTLILAFMRERYADPVGLDELARRLGLSASRCAHVVRECCGEPFSDLLNEARVRAAAALLRHTPLGLIDVAQRAGFNDLSNFHRQFKRRLGVTPRRYRRLSEPATQLTIEGKAARQSAARRD